MTLTGAVEKVCDGTMWFFVRDSWIALLPRWAGVSMLVWAALRAMGVI